MSELKIGDMAMFVGNPSETAEKCWKYIGQQCEVTGGYEYRHDDHYRTYAVTFSDGTKMSVIKWALSKLPPKQGTTTWEDIQQIIGWVPNKQGVES